MSARENFDGPYVWDKPGLSGYLVCLVHLVSLLQPNKPDRPNRPNEQDRLADCFSILLVDGLVLSSQSADQEVGPKANSREHGDAQHHLLMPAHPRLCLASR
jgi:hypothetical protein